MTPCGLGDSYRYSGEARHSKSWTQICLCVWTEPHCMKTHVTALNWSVSYIGRWTAGRGTPHQLQMRLG